MQLRINLVKVTQVFTKTKNNKHAVDTWPNAMAMKNPIVARQLLVDSRELDILYQFLPHTFYNQGTNENNKYADEIVRIY